MAMSRLMRCLLVLALAPVAYGQPPGDAPSTGEKRDRDAVIKRALAGDRGEITVMEPSSTSGQGVIIGYSSGAVVHCYADRGCRAFDGTPESTLVGGVTAIAVSRRDNREIVWAAYPHGILYRCADYVCRDFLLEAGIGQ
jgi:hypothetical protein